MSKVDSFGVATVLIIFLACGSACAGTDTRAISIEQYKVLPTPEKLRVYNWLYTKSGHPKDTRLAQSFDVDPKGTMYLIAADNSIDEFATFLRYLPIIYVLAYTPNYDICNDPNFLALKEKAGHYRLTNGQRTALGSVSVGTCSIF